MHLPYHIPAGARIKRVECDEGGGQFKAPFKAYRVILDKNGGIYSISTTRECFDCDGNGWRDGGGCIIKSSNGMRFTWALFQ